MGEAEQLVRRAKKRDADAFTELMQLYETDLYRTASAILPQDADIADAIQETILACWENIDTLQKNRYFKTWMILINKCRDILRAGNRMVCVEELPEQEAGNTVETEANLEWKEALRGLDEKYRLIVVLFYAEGLRTAVDRGVLWERFRTIEAGEAGEKDFPGQQRSRHAMKSGRNNMSRKMPTRTPPSL